MGKQDGLSAREAAVLVLDDVDRRDSYAEIALSRRLSGAGFAARDRALSSEIVYGVLRRRMFLDYCINALADRGIRSIDPDILNVIRAGMYQIRFLDRIPDSAAVDESVKLAVKRLGVGRASGFVNGILRSFIRNGDSIPMPEMDRDPVTALSVRHSVPGFVVELFMQRLGLAETRKLLETMDRVPPTFLRVNLLRSTRSGVLDSIQSRGNDVDADQRLGEAIRARRLGSVQDLPEHRAGLVSLQDISSMLASHALDLQPGMRVLDACAGLGGKSTHIAELMKDTGRVVAIDSKAHKLALLRSAAGRLGLTCIETHEGNLQAPVADLGRFDRVLVDAPCSGLGVFGRHPDARYRRKPSDIGTLSRIQAAILANAADRLKSGGVMVYCTCTLAQQENEDLVNAFVSSSRGFALDPIPSELVEGFSSHAESGEAAKTLTLWPHLDDSDGFFLARLRRL